TIIDRVAEFGQKQVLLTLDFENKIDKRIVGVLTDVTVKNPFGKAVLSQSFENEVTVPPKTKQRNEASWVFQDNPFINGEPYDKLWQIAQQGTAKIYVQIRKAILDDGTVLEAGPAPATRLI